MRTSARKKKRMQMLALGVIVLIAASAAVILGLRGSVEYFKSPSQIASGDIPDGLFRIGGLVKEGSFRQEGEEISFTITDLKDEIKVSFRGILPDLVVEGQGVIARGEIAGERFVASEVLAKHDEEYMPREIVDALKEEGTYRE